VGLIEWLSTCGFKKEWSNAARNGAVTLSSSDWMTDLDFVLGHHGCLSSSHSKKDSWFSLELPLGLWILPHHYSIRHGFSSGANALRDWELQGSADGVHWVCLRAHTNDHTLNDRFAVGTWGVGYGDDTKAANSQALKQPPDATCVHRFVRVLMTGVNSSKGRELRCSGFEIYGQVYVDNPVATISSPLWYLRKWALEALLSSLLQQRQLMEGGTGAGFHVDVVVEEMRGVGGIDATGFVEQCALVATRDPESALQVTHCSFLSLSFFPLFFLDFHTVSLSFTLSLVVYMQGS